MRVRNTSMLYSGGSCTLCCLAKFTSTGLFAYSIIERRLFNTVAGEFIQCVNEREGETCHLSEEPEISTSISRVLLFNMVATEPMT